MATEPRPLASAYAAPAPSTNQRRRGYGLALARLANGAIVGTVSFVRRFTRLRALFDHLFQKPLTQATQWLIRRRLRDHGLAIADEQILSGEEEVIQRITTQMTAFLFRNYRDSVAERAGNTKTYGLLKAWFEVQEDLDDGLRAGIFATPRRYPAWVRFGGPGPYVTSDIKNNGVLSIGIKLMEVAGDKLIDDERGTQDFLGISTLVLEP